MQVVVVPPNVRWSAEFEKEAVAIHAELAECVVAVHHIGSTAIHGIPAKPIIDMLVVVTNLEELDRHSDGMRSSGYEVMGEFGIVGRRYFRKSDLDGQRTHHVHAFQVGSDHIARHLAFRDFLNAHPERARTYGELKLRLAAAHPDDMSAYIEGKEPFIKETEAEALRWAKASLS